MTRGLIFPPRLVERTPLLLLGGGSGSGVGCEFFENVIKKYITSAFFFIVNMHHCNTPLLWNKYLIFWKYGTIPFDLRTERRQLFFKITKICLLLLKACFALNSRVSGTRPTYVLARVCLTVGCIAYGDGSNSVRLINEDGHNFWLSLGSKTILFPASLADFRKVSVELAYMQCFLLLVCTFRNILPCCVPVETSIWYSCWCTVFLP